MSAAAAGVAVALVVACAGPAGAPSPTAASPAPPAVSLGPSARRDDIRLVMAVRRGLRSELVVLLVGGAAARIALPEGSNGPVVRGPDGRLAFAAGSARAPTVYVAPTTEPEALGSLAPAAWAPWPIPAGLDPVGGTYRWVCLGPGGRVGVQADDGFLVVLQGGSAARPVVGPRRVYRPGGCAWLDDRRILFAVEGNGEDPAPALALVEVATGTTEIVRMSGESPAVSPDGSRLAFVTREGDDFVVSIGPAPRPGTPGAAVSPEARIRLVPDAGGAFDHPTFSRAGARLALLSRDAAARAVAIEIDALGPDGARPVDRVPLAEVDDAVAVWLPDGP